MNCPACKFPINPGARFCSSCGAPIFSQPPTPAFSARLVRPRYGRAIGGVCAGFAQHFGWDVVLVRILLCVLVLFGCGTPIIAYLIAWIVMPNEPYYFAPTVPVPPTTQPTP